MTDILTLQDLAEYLKISEKTLYGYAQKGKIPGIKIGSAWRFRKPDIDRWLDEQRQLTETSTSSARAADLARQEGPAQSSGPGADDAPNDDSPQQPHEPTHKGRGRRA